MPNLNQTVLLVDDDENDRFLIRRSFRRLGIVNPLYEVSGGAEAIAYLAGEGEYADRTKFPFPSVLMLDLQMPRINGLEVLQWIRSKLTMPGLLVIVLSRSDEIRYVNRAYALGANSFLTKPGNEQELEGLISAFRDYWLIRNEPPRPVVPIENPNSRLKNEN